MTSTGRARGVGSVVFWSILPVVLTGVASVLGVINSLEKKTSPDWLLWTVTSGIDWLFWTLVVALALMLLLIARAINDHVFGRSLTGARYDTVRELHNRLGPALDGMAELALTSPSAKTQKKSQLKQIANNCCSALVAMTPRSKDVRATVFELTPTAVKPLAHFGRSDAPRTFALSSEQGQEIEAYLKSGTPSPELYRDTRRDAPAHYVGAPNRYQTFIRMPIFANGIVFGMVAVDAPKAKSLDTRDRDFAVFVATQLAAAFAIAAD